MTNILLETSEKIQTELLNELSKYSFAIGGPANPQSILIKEINQPIDIKRLAQFQKQTGGRAACVIKNGDHIFDILELKPFSILRINKINQDCLTLIEKIQQSEKHLDQTLEFKSGDMMIRLNADQILYLESYLHYLIIHTISAEFTVREKISSALSKLQPFGFVQIHKSILINKRYLQSFSSTECRLCHDIVLPIGRKYSLNKA